ncbi:MAG TPA: histidine--tRNA ligase [Candidatus Dormibacteraeota bacterium]|nr:histidine--tRNA ligase [Candidatus Dormibacteraeota bacterium]
MSEGVVKKEEKARKFQAIRGTRDLLPAETELWNRVEQSAREVFGTFGFGEIRTPIFEPTELFARAVGGETDIVSKEMYTFADKPINIPSPRDEGPKRYIANVAAAMHSGEIPASERILGLLKYHAENYDLRADKSLADAWLNWVYIAESIVIGESVSLRPEATASVCRAYIEHGMHALPQPVKMYYMGPMFRRERPQKGRYRQFYQIGAEVLEAVQPGQGTAKDIPKDAAIDAEVIEMVMAFFEKLKLQGVQLDVNSIGCRECRAKYVEALRAALVKVKDQLGPDSQRRIETNPLRVLDSKLESEQGIIATLPRIADYLCENCATHFAALKRNLDLREVKYQENWRLVRGLDYYMRTTFEITSQGLGSQNAVCGGGRYDGLVELLGGHPTKGIGFAIGEDRLILSLQDAGKGDAKPSRDVYIAWMGEKAYATAVRVAKALRKSGFSVELPPAEQKFGKALGNADKLGAQYALILGENEIAEGIWTLKTLADGTQAKFTEAELMEHLKKGKAAE